MTSDNQQKLSARRGAFWVALGAAVAAGSQAVLLLFAGFFLTPIGLGYLAVGLFLFGASALVTPLGNDYSLVLRPRLAAREFWLLVIKCGLVSLLAAIAGVYLYDSLFAETFLIPTSVISASLVAGTFEGLHLLGNAGLQRSLRYRELELISILKQSLILIAGVTTLYFTRDVVSLLMVRAAAALLGLGLCGVALRQLLQREQTSLPLTEPTGRDMLIKSLINYLSRNSEVVIAGPQIGLVGLGFYDFSRRVVARPRDLLAGAMFRFAYPLLSNVNTIENPRVRARVFWRIYCDTVKFAAAAGIPTFMAAFLLAGGLFQVVFGPQWDGAVPVFRIFAVTAIVQTIGNGLVPAALTALGYSRAAMTVEVVTIIPQLIAIFVASYFGITALAAASCGFVVIKLLAMQHYLIVKSQVTYRQLYHAVRPFALASVAAAIPTYAIVAAWNPAPISLVIASGTFVAVYLAAARLVFWNDFVSILRIRTTPRTGSRRTGGDAHSPWSRGGK